MFTSGRKTRCRQDALLGTEPVAADGLGEHNGHQALHVLAAGVEGVDDGHARVVARPQCPVARHPCPRLCPPSYTHASKLSLVADQFESSVIANLQPREQS